jgi:succinate dehydrogenase / fumarate reductase flavoprotein subunit
MYNRHEMLDLVKVDGHAKGIIVRNMATGEVSRHAGDAVVLATGGYGNVFFLSTNAQGCNVTAAYRAHKRGAGMANPCYTQIHPTCIPVHGDKQSKLTLMSESLRNDGRIWTPKDAEVAAMVRKGEMDPNSVAEDDRDYFLERKYPSFGNLAPRDISSRAAKEACDEGRGVASTGLGVFLDFRDAIKRDGQNTIKERYGNLFDMYQCITGDNPYETPMMIFPAVHYTMGGLWVDYNLESTIPGMFVGGEANFSDHGANRLGASALMQGLSDGYFVLPYTVGNYLGEQGVAAAGAVTTEHPAFAEVEADVKARIDKLLSIGGNESPRSFHKRLGHIIWENCGMARSKEGLEGAIKDLQALRKEFWTNLRVVGDADGINPELERAGRVADFIEFGELMCRDALMREESCGGHFRVEYQTEDGEALRDDENFTFAGVWEYQGDDVEPQLHKEPLIYENVKLATRSYK